MKTKLSKRIIWWHMQARILQKRGMTLREIAEELGKEYGEVCNVLYYHRYPR